MTKAIILDLDNTIYPVSSIGRHCFSFYLNFLFHKTIFTKTIRPFSSYTEFKKLPYEKYLVTDGITQLQKTKIQQLRIEKDFKKIYIIDPTRTKATKKDLFQKILIENRYLPADVLVVGDDLQADIKPAQELAIPAVLFDLKAKNVTQGTVPVITSFNELHFFIK